MYIDINNQTLFIVLHYIVTHLNSKEYLHDDHVHGCVAIIKGKLQQLIHTRLFLEVPLILILIAANEGHLRMCFVGTWWT